MRPFARSSYYRRTFLWQVFAHIAAIRFPKTAFALAEHNLSLSNPNRNIRLRISPIRPIRSNRWLPFGRDRLS